MGSSTEPDLQAVQQVRRDHAACVVMPSDNLLSILRSGQSLSHPVILMGPVTLVQCITARFLTHERFDAQTLLEVPSFAHCSDALDAHMLFKTPRVCLDPLMYS